MSARRPPWPRSMLLRKALRDARRQRGPLIAIVAVVMVGVASFVAMQSMVPHLREAQRRYYASAHYADLWVAVARAPDAVARDMARIPGVAAVETRVAADVVLDVPGLSGAVAGRVLSYPIGRPLAVNRLHLRLGRLPTASAVDEVVVSDGFASANALVPGDSIAVVLNGRWRRLTIVGVVMTPEFIMEVKPGDLFPDNRRYGILWLPEDAVRGALGLTGAWNEATVLLAPGASRAAVIACLDVMLDRYGTLGAYDRNEQVSHRYLTDEIRQAATFGTAAPVIFLGVAAFLVNLVLGRLVTAQREQIGMLKAFGFSPSTLAGHYLFIAAQPIVVGTAMGTLGGLFLAGALARLYGAYYRMPDAVFTPSAVVVAQAVLVTVLAALAGTLGAVRRVLRLPAAEAMRPETPLRFRQGWFDRSRWQRRLTSAWRLTIRDILRRPARTALAMVGMALSVAVVMVGGYAYDAIALMRDVHFTDIQREDVAVSFVRREGDAALRELARIPGVTHVEPLASLPVRLRHGARVRRAAITAIMPNATLRRVVGADRRPRAQPIDGLMLSSALAELLDVAVGDSVVVEVLSGRQRQAVVRVAGLVDDLIGTGSWMPFADARRLAGGTWYDGAALSVERHRVHAAVGRLRALPGVAGIGERAAMLASFDKVVRDSFGVTLAAMLAFAVVLSVGVVYNTARIALSERARELASLRVLGFSRSEVAGMLFGELGLLGVLSIPLGLLVGAMLCAAMAAAMSSELFRLPFTISMRTYIGSGAVLVIAGLASSLPVRRQLDRVDLVSMLKTRE